MQARQTINYWFFWFICLLISERSWRRRVNPVSCCSGDLFEIPFLSIVLQKALHRCSDVFYGRPDGGSSKATDGSVFVCASPQCVAFFLLCLCVWQLVQRVFVGHSVDAWRWLRQQFKPICNNHPLLKQNKSQAWHAHTHAHVCSSERRKYESPDTYMCLPMCATLASSSHVPCSHNNGQQIKL